MTTLSCLSSKTFCLDEVVCKGDAVFVAKLFYYVCTIHMDLRHCGPSKMIRKNRSSQIIFLFINQAVFGLWGENHLFKETLFVLKSKSII